MMDIPLWSFGSVAEWFCENDSDLLTLFNSRFPLPGQGSWTVFWITSKLFMCVTSVLWMQAIKLKEWRQLPKIGTHIGSIGAPILHLWDWSLTYRGLDTLRGHEISLACFKLLPCLQQTYDGWQKEDPPMMKMLPVESDVPEWLVERGRESLATELDRAVGDLVMVAFYYLLQIG